MQIHDNSLRHTRDESQIQIQARDNLKDRSRLEANLNDRSRKETNLADRSRLEINFNDRSRPETISMIDPGKRHISVIDKIMFRHKYSYLSNTAPSTLAAYIQ